jgi:hypothetical protein
MIEEIRDLFQNLIAPQLEGIRGDIRALDAKIQSVDSKCEFRRELLAEIRRVEEGLSSDFVRLEQKVDLQLGIMNEKLDSTAGSFSQRSAPR